LEREWEILKVSYLEALIAALEDCASGRQGLFRQGVGFLRPAPDMPQTASRLSALGDELELVRRELGHAQPFEPMRRLALLRQRGGCDARGEERLAQNFLSELAISE
jgi:hypothetical protein